MASRAAVPVLMRKLSSESTSSCCALRAGGRLACVSALHYYGVIDDVPGPIHI